MYRCTINVYQIIKVKNVISKYKEQPTVKYITQMGAIVYKLKYSSLKMDKNKNSYFCV